MMDNFSGPLPPALETFCVVFTPDGQQTIVNCDDEVYCNGQELCLDHTCVGGAAPCSPHVQCNETAHLCEGVACPDGVAPFLPTVEVGLIDIDALTEASGLAASRQNPGVLWTHNDSGGLNVVFAIALDGTPLGTYNFGPSPIWDTEAIAIGPGPAGGEYLYWGDIGDNDNVRNSVEVRRAPEPIVDPHQPPVTASLENVELITLRYPTGAHAPLHKDAESMFVDPVTGDLYIVTKRSAPNRIYRAAYPQPVGSPIVMQWVADLPPEFNGTPESWGHGPTGGDISPDGSAIVLRQYSSRIPAAAIWYRPLGTALADAFAAPYCPVELAPDGIGEAICWDREGLGLFTTQDQQTRPPLRYKPRNTGLATQLPRTGTQHGNGLQQH